jgi:hypothetical protein
MSLLRSVLVLVAALISAKVIAARNAVHAGRGAIAGE